MSQEHEVIELERAALARWCSGDPSGFLEISAPDVTYFDPFVPKRIDGLPALERYYEEIRGKVQATRYELVSPVVTATAEMAVLTYHFNSWGGSDDGLRWNCTEVFRRRPEGWRIIQTHWSFTEGTRRPQRP
jgi:hypothetical protein